MVNYQIVTYGCKLNQAESLLIEEKLNKSFIKSSLKEADFVLINSCGIIEKTENKIIKKIKELKKNNKDVVISGCLPKINPQIKEEADFVFENNNPDLIEKELLKKYNPQKTTKKEEDKKDDCSIIIPISTGCLGNCSYCAARLARGKLKSHPQKHIIERIKKSDFKEIQLTSQDLGIYGMDFGKPLLVNLVSEIIKIEKDFKLKLGMMNPGFIHPFFDELINLFEDEKLYRFIHIPVQSGDNKILKKMNRNHTAEDFSDLVEKIRLKFDNFLIATDIIVGFPGETDYSFQKTVDLIKKTKPNIVNITRFSKRKQTPAFGMIDLPEKIKKERSRKLNLVAKKIKMKDNESYLGKTGKVLVVKNGKNNTFLSRMNNGKAVILNKGKVGEFKHIKIVDFKENYLIGN